MKIGILKEDSNEYRVSITPNIVNNLVQKGFEVFFENDCGIKSNFSNLEYQNAGGILSDKVIVYNCDIIIKINAPDLEELMLFKDKSILICHMNSFDNQKLFDLLKTKKIQAYALELIPRISRAQSMDILSSQSNLVGYHSVIQASYLGGFVLPMMITSAGSIPPAKAFIIGAGVAGLQAIATAKRLGCIVSAYDVRADTKEQVESLGAKFICVDSKENISGVYAKQMSDDYKQKEREVLLNHISKQDIIITTALILGKKPPILIDEEMFQVIKKGSVIVDLAVFSGGNCVFSQPNKIIEKNGIKIIGYNIINSIPSDASKLFAKNVFNFLSPHIKDSGILDINYDDEIIIGSLLSKDGVIVNKFFIEGN